jgi:hypothetical protein
LSDATGLHVTKRQFASTGGPARGDLIFQEVE